MNKIVYIRTTGIYDDSRATKEILALSELDAEIIVLAWDRNGDSLHKCKEVFSAQKNIRFEFFNQQIDSGIGTNNYGIILKWRKWARNKIKEIGTIDIVHVCNLDAGLPVLGLHMPCNCKLVYDIYDYYVDSHNLPSSIRNIVEKFEINLINRSNITIICTEERREQIAKAKPKRVVVIHNSPDISELNIEHDEELLEYDYAYCGTMNGGRLIKEVLEKYPDHKEICMIFAGNGSNAILAEQYADKYEKFHYAGKIPYSDVLAIEKKSKVISAIYSPNVRNHRLCAPNKFYEALALGKPLIVCKGTGIDRIVEENQIGVTIDYNADEFYDALKSLINNAELCKKIRERAKALYQRNYRWEIMKTRIIKEYKEILG